MADIELVIKIPENTYRQIQALARNNYFEHDICGNSMRRIANGTPLPKEHGRLIDADKLEPDYDWSEYETDTGQLMVYGYQAYSSTQIESAPTIIEADEVEE